MLDFKQDSLVVLPYSNLIREIVNLKSINHVYDNKFTDAAYSIYKLAHDIINTLRDMRNNPDVHSYEIFVEIIENIQVELDIPETPDVYETLYMAFLRDTTNLQLALEESNLTEISNLLDIYKVTYNNIYVTIINLDKK